MRFGVSPMPLNWPTSQLRDLADIRVSNVDKKSYAAERPIRLCNYMDVYANGNCSPGVCISLKNP